MGNLGFWWSVFEGVFLWRLFCLLNVCPFDNKFFWLFFSLHFYECNFFFYFWLYIPLIMNFFSYLKMFVPFLLWGFILIFRSIYLWDLLIFLRYGCFWGMFIFLRSICPYLKGVENMWIKSLKAHLELWLTWRSGLQYNQFNQKKNHFNSY